MYFYVIKFGNENEIHLAGYKRSKVAALKLNAASLEKEKEDRNRFWQNSQMTFNFFSRLQRIISELTSCDSDSRQRPKTKI